MLLQLAVKSRNSHGIVPLKLTNSYVHHSEDQAEILNKQSNLFLLRNIYLTFLNAVGKSILIAKQCGFRPKYNHACTICQ